MESKLSRQVAWTVWTLSTVFYTFQFILRVMPSIMMDHIIAQYNIDAQIFGQYSGIYYIGYSFAHVPLGIVLDRYGPKRIMSLCIFLTALGLSFLAFSTKWEISLLGRFIIGVGSSGAALGLLSLTRIAFDDRIFTRMVTSGVSIGLVGGIYGGTPMKYVIEYLGYDSTIYLFVGIGLCLAVISYIFTPHLDRRSDTSFVEDLKVILSNKKAMLVCFLGGLMIGPIEGFTDAWGAGFFKNIYGLPADKASFLPSVVFIGYIFGPLLSIIAEKSGSYFRTIIGAGLLMFGVFILLLTRMLNIYYIYIALFLVGICSAYQVLVVYKASGYLDKRRVNLACIVSNMIVMAFGYVFHTVIGTLISSMGGVHDSNAYLIGISSIPIGLILGVVGYILFFRNKG